MTRNVKLTKELSYTKIDQRFVFTVPDLPRLGLVGPVFYRCKDECNFNENNNQVNLNHSLKGALLMGLFG